MHINKDFIQSGKYLPKILKGEDEKEIFKMISLFYEDIAPLGNIDWPVARAYVINKFLVFMACHGYILAQVDENATGLNFCDLEDTKKQYDILYKEKLIDLIPLYRDLSKRYQEEQATE